MKKYLLVIGLFTTFYMCFSQGIKPATGAFSFNVLDIAEESVVSCRDLNTEITNESPHVVVSEDGHLSVDGKRLRIFGTNLSSFPEKDQAERNARNLADRGFNCIRFHHTDADWSNCFIKKMPDGRRILDVEAMDKFDYFVSFLKKYGIYVNFNLLTGRTYTEKDGMPRGTDKIQDWKNRHLIGFWNDQARTVQKNYARKILEHVNPYTGIALKDDPVLSIVEINNEQGIIHSYFSNNFADTPDNLWQELEVKWNEWLSEKEISYETLSKKYNHLYQIGEVLVDNGSKWHLEQHDGAKASQSGNDSYASITVKANGKQSWNVQFNTSGISIDRNNVYTIAFKAKTSKKCDISVDLMMAHDPWQNLGWSKKISLGKEWGYFEFVVTGLEHDENARLNFGNMGFLADTKIDLRDIKMFEGGNVVAVKQSANGVRLPRSYEYSELPEGFKKTILDFLYDVEVAYWTDMRDYVRNELGCPALLMGTAMGNTTTGLSMLFDIVDSHAYFNHPVFPGSDWDQNNFYVHNDDMTLQESSRTLTNLAGFRVFGKPFSVSEYDHPYPNQFGSQMYPMLAAFASYQDWDAVYTFCSDVIKGDENMNRKISDFFDQTRNPVKAAAAPVAARIFRTGAIEPESSYVWMNLNEEKERDNLHKFGGWSVGNPSVWGFDPVMALESQTGIFWNETPENLKGFEVNDAADYIKETKQRLKKADEGVQGTSSSSSIFWEEEKGTFRAMGENAFIYVGHGNSPLLKADRKDEVNNFEFIPSGDFSSVMGVKLNDGKWIFYAASWSGNRGELLKEYGMANPYSGSSEVVQRANVKLISRPPYAAKEAMALSVQGTLKSLKGKMKLSHMTEKGLVKGYAFSNDSFDLKENSGTLWYLLEP